MTPEVLGKLEQAFSLGCSDREACLYADINPDTLYNYQKKNPEFVERKEILKESMVLKSRAIIHKALNSDDADIAKWYLERKKKLEFSARTDHALSADGENVKFTIKIGKPLGGPNDQES